MRRSSTADHVEIDLIGTVEERFDFFSLDFLDSAVLPLGALVLVNKERAHTLEELCMLHEIERHFVFHFEDGLEIHCLPSLDLLVNDAQCERRHYAQLLQCLLAKVGVAHGVQPVHQIVDGAIGRENFVDMV